jgi:integral membrane protein
MAGEAQINKTHLSRLRLLGHIEAITTILLFFVAMPLKYVFGMPEAVRVMGSLHGGLFLLYLAYIFYSLKKIPLPATLAGACAFAAIIPFGPFLIDPKLKKLSIS